MDVDQVGERSTAMEVDEETHPAKQIFDEMLDKARDLETKNPEQAVAAYRAIIANKEEVDDPSAKGREQAIFALGDLFVKQKNAQEIVKMNTELRPLFEELSKSKAAKIVRHLIDLMAKIPGARDLQIGMCQECIDWCKGQKRTFLRQRVETRLAATYLETQKYDKALELLSRLNIEVKKLDDKLMLVEIALLECRTHYAVQNIPKSKASLTFSKTNANAIHCPPLLQAEIDMWSGIVTSREKDFRTAFSYFYEASEAYNASGNDDSLGKAKQAMQFMLLAKIMQNRPQETKMIVNSKNGMKFIGPEIDAMLAVAKSQEDRSLQKFEEVLNKYKAELDGDPIISYHLKDLNDTLLEQNILRILEPFSRVEIEHVADLIHLPVPRTQAKLSEMILDQKLKGTLDQGIGVLIVFEEEEVRPTYNNSLSTIKNTSEVLDTLYGMAKQIA